jgi:hypothetical protein
MPGVSSTARDLHHDRHDPQASPARRGPGYLPFHAGGLLASAYQNQAALPIRPVVNTFGLASSQVHMTTEKQQKKRQVATRVCPVCKGTGLDQASHPRYTTGGHDDRSCPRCHGECYIEVEPGITQNPNEASG